MAFKLGREKRGFKGPDNTPIFRKDLEGGVQAEANMDGSIYINELIDPNSEEYKQVINHEMRHSTDIRIGKLEYGDDYVKWDGNTYPRQEINGLDMILVDGQWQEAGTGSFPWDKESQKEHKIAVVPTIIIFKDGEEVARFQADLSFKMVATKEEVQEEIDNQLMSDF